MVKMTVLENKNIKFIYKGAFLMKKVIAILMLIFMLTVMFYGCGKGKVKDTTLSSVTTATTGTTANTTTPPVDHVKEYDEEEWKRQLDNLKYGEAPEYLKQIGLPSEEDVAFIRKELGDGYCLISDPRQIWNKDFHKTRNRSVYIGTFDIGDGESIVYFMGINSSGGAVIVAPSVSYYKKSGKVQLTDIPPQLEEYKELFSLRCIEYIGFADVVSWIIY